MQPTDDRVREPVVVIEALSRTTADRDRSAKWVGYQDIPSLQHYVLVAQDVPAIDHYHREAPDVWTLRTVAGLEASLQVATLQWTVALADVYDRVEFPGASIGEVQAGG